MHLVAIGQYLTAQVFGGPEARENFGMRTLGRYTPAAWRTLVPEHQYVAKSAIRGRVQVCSADTRRETQVPFLSHEECVQWAGGGLAGVIPAGMLAFEWEPSGLLSPVPSDELVDWSAELAEVGVRPDLRLVPSPDDPAGARDLVGLSAACAPGGPLDGLSLHAARKARQRDETFPKPDPDRRGQGCELMYSRAALADWSAGRADRRDGDQR
jgi:hypothetical protein